MLQNPDDVSSGMGTQTIPGTGSAAAVLTATVAMPFAVLRP